MSHSSIPPLSAAVVVRVTSPQRNTLYTVYGIKSVDAGCDL